MKLNFFKIGRVDDLNVFGHWKFWTETYSVLKILKTF